MKKYTKEQFMNMYHSAQENWESFFIENIQKGHKSSPEIIENTNRFSNLIEKFNEHNEYLTYVYSNDSLINEIMLFFIDNASVDLKNELKKIYVGKIDNFEINAFAHQIDKEYEGFLVTLNFGLEFQLSVLTEIFTPFVFSLIGGDPEKKKDYTDYMHSNIDILSDHAVINLDYFSKRKEFPIGFGKISYQFYFGLLAFVISHEIGHHFLQHTDNNYKKIMSRFIDEDVYLNSYQLDEFAADQFAIETMFRDNRFENASNKRINRFMLSAPLYVMLVLAINDKNPEQSSDTHPSVKSRFIRISNEIKAYCSHEDYEIIIITFDQIITLINDKNKIWEKIWWK